MHEVSNQEVDQTPVPPLDAEAENSEQVTAKRMSKYYVIFKDGEVHGRLNKAQCAKMLEDDDDSGEIAMVLFGKEVTFTTKRVAKVTLS